VDGSFSISFIVFNLDLYRIINNEGGIEKTNAIIKASLNSEPLTRSAINKTNGMMPITTQKISNLKEEFLMFLS